MDHNHRVNLILSHRVPLKKIKVVRKKYDATTESNKVDSAERRLCGKGERITCF